MCHFKPSYLAYWLFYASVLRNTKFICISMYPICKPQPFFSLCLKFTEVIEILSWAFGIYSRAGKYVKSKNQMTYFSQMNLKHIVRFGCLDSQFLNFTLLL